MRTSALRKWSWVHKWTSLICTVFLLLMCVTGLPLIFHHEIDHLLHAEVEPADVPAGTPPANLDKVLSAAMEKATDKVPHFLIWDRDEPNIVMVSVGPTIDADPSKNQVARVDAHTAAFLDMPDFTGKFTYIMFRLHTDMYAGLPGKLFLGLMGLLFVVAIVSGVILYGPWMRKLDFGTVRNGRGRMLRWLDLHNLLGAVTIVWALVVGFTGVINTWADLVIKIWQFGQLAEMTASYKDALAPAKAGSIQAAVDRARKEMPEMAPSFVAFPGTILSSKQHYAVFMRGDTPLTSRMLRPALIDATTCELTDSRNLPWYVTTLLVSQPLHFGDYGGMTLKIVWALLDVLTIIVLVTGLYLWWARRRWRAREPVGRVQAAQPAE
jgi:uncharacterized iron-regulated membrane protein